MSKAVNKQNGSNLIYRYFHLCGYCGGGEGSRTPVRKPVHRTFYKLSKKDLIPRAPSLLQNCEQVASF